MGPTWGQSGTDRTQVGPMLATWTLLSGNFWHNIKLHFQVQTDLNADTSPIQHVRSCLLDSYFNVRTTVSSTTGTTQRIACLDKCTLETTDRLRPLPARTWLIHWSRDKMAAVSQTIFSNALHWMKMFEFRLKFHWSLLLRIQITIFNHWFR